MTTQVSIFEETNENEQVMQVITTRTFYGHQLEVYGDFQEPWFLARDIAEMIDYSTASLNKFLQSVDDNEKERKTVPTLGGVQKSWFLTEQGLYEVLFQSRKPKAKEFKSWVKQVLKEIRVKGYYMAGELVEQAPAPTDDLSYIKGKLADLQQLDNISDINKGMVVINRIILTLSHEDASSEKWHQLTGQ